MSNTETRKKEPALIFFDIDGTILNEKTKEIPDHVVSAIRTARKNGNYTFINTGRSICGVENSIREIGFDGYVCGCGTYVEFQNSVLLQNSIPEEMGLKIIHDIKECKLEAILEGTAGVYYDNPEIIRSQSVKRVYDRHQSVEEIPVKNWNTDSVIFDKFCIWIEEDSDFSKFYNTYKEEYDFIDRGNNFYEVVTKGYSKASGIEVLMKHLGISHDATYAIGDSSNDLPMLEYVKYSIAMGNAPSFLKGIVSFVTNSVEDRGIEFALKQYSLI